MGDKAGMERDLQEARGNLEDAMRGKAEMDKNGKLLQGSIVDCHTKLAPRRRGLRLRSWILRGRLRRVRLPWLLSTRTRSLSQLSWMTPRGWLILRPGIGLLC